MRERTLRTALTVSLVLNLFALGAAGGGAVMWLNLHHPPLAARGRPIRNAADALPATERVQYLAAFRATVLDVRPIQRAARQNRRLAATLFVQPKFDPVAVSAALARARDADFAVRARLEGTMVTFAQNLPQTDRATLAQGLARGGPLRQPKGRNGNAGTNEPVRP
jgi:uncharacterized membrane protein